MRAACQAARCPYGAILPPSGKIKDVLVSRIDQLLALTDPYELAQAAERHVSSLSGKRIRALLRDAGPRLGEYYRDELARLAGASDFDSVLTGRYSDAALRSALAQFLKSNLRAIPIFGSGFGHKILERTPLDRAVGIGEERSNTAARAAVVAGAALALVVAGAAGEHVVAGARLAAASPSPPVPLLLATPSPVHHNAATRRVVARVATPAPTEAPSQPTPTPAATSPPATPTAVPTVRATGAPPSATPVPARAAAAVEVTAPPETPSPEPSDIDTSDMPESYSDATPLPQQSLTPAEAPQHAIRVPTPKPSPKRHGWLHRAVMHLDPFKPNTGNPENPQNP